MLGTELLSSHLTHPNSYVEALTLIMSVFRDRASREKLRLNDVIQYEEHSSKRTGILLRRWIDTRELSPHACGGKAM